MVMEEKNNFFWQIYCIIGIKGVILYRKTREWV